MAYPATLKLLLPIHAAILLMRQSNSGKSRRVCHSSTSIPQWLHAWQSGSISMFGCYLSITYKLFHSCISICCSGSKPSLCEQQTNT